MKKSLIKVVSLAASASMALSCVPVLAAQETEYATREYVVSEFVQSVGRSNLTSNGYVFSTFKDSKNVSIEYADDLVKATSNGLLQGYDDGTIRPKDNITRVEALTILSRCIPETDDVIGEPIEFRDVPQWAKKTIDGLSKAGIVEGYGNGILGAQDYITVEQVKLLTDRADELLNTVHPGESFYGYVNNKAFRNFEQGQSAFVDYIHGVLVPNTNYWSSLGDVTTKITEDEDKMLKKLVNGEIKYEDGTPEQRIYDMLSCIASKEDTTSDDLEYYNGFRQKIIDAENVDELLKAAEDIVSETGVSVLFDINNSLESEKHDVYPYVDVKAPGLGGLINYSSVAKKNCGDKYEKIMTDCLKYSGMDFSSKDIKDAIKLQEKISAKKSYLANYENGLLLKAYFDPDYTEEQMEKDLAKLKKEHPDEDENQENVVYTLEEADSKIKGIKVSEMLSNVGFKNFENVMMPSDKVLKSYNGILTDSNLKALKANALLTLEQEFMFFVNEKEEKAYNDLAVLNFAAIMLEPIDESVFEDNSETILDEDEQTAEETDDSELSDEERLLTKENLLLIGDLLPMDIGIMYCNQYYDDNTSEVIGDMMDQIWNAYIERFKKNTWMSEETKENAIKKINNMVAVIGYPDNYDFPEIVAPEDGGTYFKNVINIKKDNLNTRIKECAEQGFIRTEMFMAPDIVNACYQPLLNSMNITAGILNPPVYDPNASYASNLGAIGAVIGHEIGHAFDAVGSQFDENGVMKDWWTPEDAKKYEEIKEHFIEYYKDFEVMDGVVQDSETTITENMADFAGMQCIMDIVGDDPEAQKDALEAWAKVWAEIGSASIIADESSLHDVHSSNQVRVNAIIASLDAYYDLYDIDEDDEMYVAPEDRLRLW